MDGHGIIYTIIIGFVAGCRAKKLKAEIPFDSTSSITAIHSQGYGLQLVFDDGHDRGIYPWQYLHGMH